MAIGEGGRDGFLNFWGLVLAAVITTAGGVYIGIQHNRFEAEKERLQARIVGLEKSGAADSPAAPEKVSDVNGKPECKGYIDEITSLKDQLRRCPDVPIVGPRVEEAEGHLFELEGCNRKNDKVKCDLLVTSKNQDRLLTFWGTSRLIDAGNEIFASHIWLGNKDNAGGNNQIQKELTRNVPLKMSLEFEGVDPSVSSKGIGLIELVCSGFKVQFRNIKVS